jgi:multiple antibiotic resistance protein
MIAYFISVWLKFLILLTPFFVLSVFLSMTQDCDARTRRIVALRVTGAVIAAALLLYFLGNFIFRVFGITIDAFRVGAGALLFLSAVSLVRSEVPPGRDNGDDDIAVVPLAIPVTIGPATTGALLVMGAERRDWMEHLIGCGALIGSILTVGAMLLLATFIQRRLGQRGVSILGKLTGLALSALAAQMMLNGINNMLRM